jgi:hypothetical protein
MKTMKYIALIFIGLFLVLSISSCKKCKGEDPRARIINNGTKKASVQIKTSGGNTVNINNIEPGTSSEYSSYAPGQVTFVVTVANTNFEKTYEMKQCFDYDIAIDANNNITSTPTDRNAKH